MNTAPVAEAQRILRRHGGDGWTELTRRYGRSFRLQGGVMSADPAVARAVLTHRPHLERRAGPYRLMDRMVPGAPGILFKDGDAWVHRLRALMPSFTSSRIDGIGGEIARGAAEHAAAWHDGESFPDLMREISRLGARIVLRVGYNLRPDHPEAAALAEELIGYKFATMRNDERYRMDELGMHPAKLRHLPWLVAGLMELGGRMRRLERRVDALLKDLPLEDPARRGWIQLLVEAGFRGRELADELNHLYGAYNAVDFAVTCALVEMDRHREWAERVRSELGEAFGDRSDLTRADLGALPRTRAFVQEVLRRYPVAMIVFRELGEPLVVEGVTLAPGTVVMLPIHALHHDDAHWDEPERFRPERWLEGTDADPFVYLPFLRGPRKCIGQDLAELQIVAVLNALRDRRIRLLEEGARISHFVVPRWDRALPFRVETVPPA